MLVRLAVRKWVVCHGHRSARFLAHIHLAVHVEVGRVQDMLEGLAVASDQLPQLVWLLGLAARYVPELEPVVVRFGLRFLYPILSEEGTALGVTETLFCELREAMVMPLAER